MKAEFHFDFGSPNCHLVHLALPQIAARTGATFDYVPVLLGGIFKATNNRSPMEAFGAVKGKLAYMQKETERFCARWGVGYTFNPHFPINTLHLMRGAVHADQAGYLAAYADAVFAHMWDQPRNMGDPEVAAAALRDSGLPAAEILAATQDPDVKAALIANTEASVARGNFGAPTVFLGDEMYFGKDALRDVEEALAKA